MEVTSELTIEEIKRKLIESCVAFDAKPFLPYLLSSLVVVNFPNKIRFYDYLKNILGAAREESQGTLELRVEKDVFGREEDWAAWNFYDQVHTYPRINLLVKEEGERLLIDVKPF